jgi:hypothetical protein
VKIAEGCAQAELHFFILFFDWRDASTYYGMPSSGFLLVSTPSSLLKPTSFPLPLLAAPLPNTPRPMAFRFYFMVGFYYVPVFPLSEGSARVVCFLQGLSLGLAFLLAFASSNLNPSTDDELVVSKELLQLEAMILGRCPKHFKECANGSCVPGYMVCCGFNDVSGCPTTGGYHCCSTPDGSKGICCPHDLRCLPLIPACQG